VVPKKEVDYLFDLDEDAYVALQLFAKRVAKAIEQVVPCARIGIVVIGLEVPHAHIHLIPINGIHDINFEGPRVQMNKNEFSALAEAIGKAL
jgi:histidine triad (HIT) family protein